MAEFIYANIQREGVNVQPYAKNIFLQLDKMSVKEASDYHGADPHFVYRVSTRQLPTTNPMLVRQRDLVIDTKIIDPKTNALRKFRIISDPKCKTLMMTWEWVAEWMRGV